MTQVSFRDTLILATFLATNGSTMQMRAAQGADSFKEVFAALNRESPSGLYVTVSPFQRKTNRELCDQRQVAVDTD